MCWESKNLQIALKGEHQLCCRTVVWRKLLVFAVTRTLHGISLPSPTADCLEFHILVLFDLIFTFPSLDPCAPTWSQVTLGPGPDCLILEASRQPRLVPKPERMASDGGKSLGGEEDFWYLLISFGISSLSWPKEMRGATPHQRYPTWRG